MQIILTIGAMQNVITNLKTHNVHATSFLFKDLKTLKTDS